jgi:hypothetical protein
MVHVFVISLRLYHPAIYHSNLSPTIYLSKSTAIYLLKSIPPFSNYWLYIRGEYCDILDIKLMKSFKTLKMADKKRDNNPKHTFKKMTQ